MKQAKKLTQSDRVAIVKDCIENNKNYAKTATKYNVNYASVCQWVKKYEIGGVEGLVDHRNGKRVDNNRREFCEEEWQKKFDEFGLSEKFEFVGRDWNSDHGRKSFVRCKSCGEEFVTYGVREVFKGNQKHLLCANCGASSDGNDVLQGLM